MNNCRSFFYTIRRKVLWLIGAIFILSANWAANVIQDSIKLMIETKVELSWLGIGYISFFFSMAFLFYKSIFNIFPRTRKMNDIEHPEKRKHLVLFLSHLDTQKNKMINGVPAGIDLMGDCKGDLDSLVAYKQANPYLWPWEMPIRAVCYHSEQLESLTIICSLQSIKQIEWFINIIKIYPKLSKVVLQILVNSDNNPFIVNIYDYESAKHQGWDFDKFDELSRALDYLVRQLREAGIPERDIMIDFTGGPKVTSVVAAAITFNRNIKAQYVQTNSPWNVVSYDIILESSKLSDFSL